MFRHVAANPALVPLRALWHTGCAQNFMTLAIAENGLDHILVDLVVLFALCILVVVCFHRLRIPPIAGFLAVGALMGPNALGLIHQVEIVEFLAEIGIVVLLFTVGMELSLRDLFKMRRSLLVGGGLQIGLTFGLGASGALLGGLEWGTAIFLGFLLSLSSTAAIAKLLQDRGELGAPHGRFAMSLCVSQDLSVVLMILSLPLLSGGMGGAGEGEFGAVLIKVGRSFALLAVTMAAAWFFVPKILDLVARTRSREVFVLTIFTMCLAAASVTAMLGLSLALGAFLVGLILAESKYRHQATAEVEPFRDALSSLFFVSIGMMFDFSVIAEYPLVVSLALAAVILGKAVVVIVAARVLGLPGWVGIRTGLLVAQVGEFSFVLIQVARGNNLNLGSIESVFIVVAVLSMALTPLMLFVGRRLTRRTAKMGTIRDRETNSPLQDHVVIVGFGPGGQAVAGALRNQGVSYVAIELNAVTVKRCRERGDKIFLGDSTREAVLRAAGLPRAKVLVMAINHAGATLRTADLARRLAPEVRIVARTNFIGEVATLQRMGVQEIVPAELETSIEIMVRVLRHFLVPAEEVGTEVTRVREGVDLPDHAARPGADDSHRLANFLPGLKVETFRVGPGAEIAGHSLQDSDLRRLSGCTVVAVRRGNVTDIAVRPDTVLEEGDVAVLIGPSTRISEAAYLFHSVSDTKSEGPIDTESDSDARESTESAKGSSIGIDDVVPPVDPRTSIKED